MSTDVRTCKCGATFTRPRFPSGRLERPTTWRDRTECLTCRPLGRHPGRRQGDPEAKTCEHCRKPYGRKRHPGGSLQTIGSYRESRYCSDGCARAARVAQAAKLAAARKAKPKPIRKAPERALSKPVRPAKPPKRPDLPPKPIQAVLEGTPSPKSAPFIVGSPRYSEGREMCEVHPHEPLTSFGCSVCNVLAKERPRAIKPHGDYHAGPR